jgi:hypothetical protein
MLSAARTTRATTARQTSHEAGGHPFARTPLCLGRGGVRAALNPGAGYLTQGEVMSEKRVYTDAEVAALISGGLDVVSLAKFPQGRRPTPVFKALYVREDGGPDPLLPTFETDWGVIQIRHESQGEWTTEAFFLDIYVDAVLALPDLEATFSDRVLSPLRRLPPQDGISTILCKGESALQVACVGCTSLPQSTASPDGPDRALNRSLAESYLSGILASGHIGQAVQQAIAQMFDQHETAGALA